MERKTPWWISPVEVLTVKKLNPERRWATYEEILMKTDRGWKLKPYDQIEGAFTGCLQYHQVNDVLLCDKKVGFEDKKSRFQIELLECRSKLLSKMYIIRMVCTG